MDGWMDRWMDESKSKWMDMMDGTCKVTQKDGVNK